MDKRICFLSRTPKNCDGASYLSNGIIFLRKIENYQDFSYIQNKNVKKVSCSFVFCVKNYILYINKEHQQLFLSLLSQQYFYLSVQFSSLWGLFYNLFHSHTKQFNVVWVSWTSFEYQILVQKITSMKENIRFNLLHLKFI